MRVLLSVVVGYLALGCKPSAPSHQSGVGPRPAPGLIARPTPSPPNATLVAEVQGAVAKVLGVPVTGVPPAVPLSNLPKPVDDLDVIEIVLALEDQFKIVIPDETLARVAGGDTAPALARGLTVEKLAGLVERLRK
jgi:acyl carrier protein